MEKFVFNDTPKVREFFKKLEEINEKMRKKFEPLHLKFVEECKEKMKNKAKDAQ